MCTYKKLLFISILFLMVSDAIAQQVWPVQVTGAMIPPRSLDLSVYGNERAADLFFNATLNDPVRSTLQVRLQLSIERNGDVIYQTDPNFQAAPITLSQFQMQTLDGGFLQPYLTPSSLVGANNTGTGSVDIPEGFNKICIQVYGVEKNVPVSNKFCVQGSFQLNQPPQAILPACGEMMEYPETQNRIFSWQAMHLGSANSPGAVEYQFEMVQLPEGTYNANDAFESALQIYQTTTMSPTLIYTQAEPLLEPNKLYAWRVKAYSMMAPTSTLFQNEGYSEICTFQYYEGEKPGTDITAVNNPAPQGCEVFKTDYGPISNNEAVTTILAESDVVKLGYFDLEITEVTGGVEGFTGKGKVSVPMFNSNINVVFSGLKVNSDWRVYEAEKIEAVVDPSFYLDKVELQAANVPTSVDANYVSSLNDFFTFGNGSNRLVSGMNQADPAGVNLPIGIDQTDQPMVAVIGIYFTARNAFLNMVSWKEQDGGSPLRFAATAVQATPYGMKTNAHLVLLNGGESVGEGEKILASLALNFKASDDSKMDCDCKGYEELNLEEGIQISSDIVVQSDNGQPLGLRLKADDFKNSINPIKQLSAFRAVGFEDFEFKAKSGILDLSTEASSDVNAVSDQFAEFKTSSWRGVILEEVSLEADPSYNFLNNNQTFSMSNGHLFIDDQHLAYGRFEKENILSFNKGKMGDWAYSIEKATLEIEDAKSNGLALAGQIAVPVFDEAFPYSGFVNNENDRLTLNAPLQEKRLEMSMWKASFLNYESSDLRAVATQVGTESQLVPSANFDGEISISMTDKELTDAVREEGKSKLSAIKEAFGISNLAFELKEVKLNDFSMDPLSKPIDRYHLGSANVVETSLTLGGKQVEPGQIDIVYEYDETSNTERLGLKMDMYEGNSNVELIIWAKKESTQFVFDEIEIKNSVLDCDCTSFIVPPTEEEWDRIFDKILKQRGYDDSIEFTSNGSLSSTYMQRDATNFNYILLKEKLRDGVQRSGFPMLTEGKIIIPFLNNRELNATESGGTYSAESYISDYTKFKFEDLKTTEPNKLPIDVTDELKIMGVKRNNIPNHAKFLITGFRSTAEGAITTGSKMDLMLVYEIYNQGGEKRYLYFQTKDVPVGPTSVDLTDVNLELINKATNNGENEIIYYPRVKLGENETQKSFAHFNCDKGFINFNVHAAYQPYFSPYKDDEKKIKLLYRLSNAQADASTGRIKEIGADTTRFFFTINTENSTTDHSLRYFISELSSEVQRDENGWNFAARDAEQLIFKPGDKEKYKAFIDYDDTHKIEDDRRAIRFKGLVFQHIEVELDGFKNKESKGLTLPIEDVVFEFGKGLKKEYVKENPVPKSDGALLGGWKYELSKVAFHLNQNKFVPLTSSKDQNDQKIQGVYISGSTLVPIFEETPPASSKIDVKFASGWVGFSGTLDFLKTGKKYEPSSSLYFNRFQESTYYSAIMPTLGISMGMGSELKLAYNDGNGEMEPQAKMNGTAGIYWQEGTAKDLGLEGNIAKITGGLAFVFDLLKFEGMTINSPDDATGCSGAETQNQGPLSGIKALNMGTWSIGKSADIKSKVGEKLKKSYGLQGFPVNVGEGMAFTCQKMEQNEVTYILNLPIEVNLMPDEQSKEEGRSFKIKGKTAGIAAKADLQFYISLKDGDFSLKDFKLGCILIEGEVGPVSVKGGLNILRDFEAEGDALNAGNVKYSKWGSGYKGGVDITVFGVNVKAVAQYGMTRYDMNNAKTETVNVVDKDGKVTGTKQVQEKYRYGFFDFEATLPVGIPVLPPSPTTAPVFYIVGGGGGFLINMDLEPEGALFKDNKTIEAQPPSTPETIPEKETKPGNLQSTGLTEANDLPDNNLCSIDDDMLTPGKSFSGIEYRPNQDAYGGNISVVLTQLDPALPKQLLAGDVTFRLGLEKNTAGTLGLSYVQVDGNLYFSPGSVATRREDFVAKVASRIKYDHPKKEVTGSLELMAEFPMKKDNKIANKLKANEKQRRAILSNDAQSAKDRFTDVQRFNRQENEWVKANKVGDPLVKLENVKAQFGAKFKDDFKWTFKLGSWGDGAGAEPVSNLKYSAITFPMLGDAAFKFYMQMGHDVDGIPPVTELLPTWNTDVNFEEIPNRTPDFSKGGDGIALGALIEAECKKSLGPLSGFVGGKIGFDASLMHFENVSCGEAEGGKIGLNGWYAKAQAYAFLKAKLDLKYDLGFREGKVNIFDAELAAMVQAQLPNPSYVHGFVKGHYSVLNGLLDGKFNYKFEFGNQCSELGSVPPVVGVPIIESTSPIGLKGQEEDVFVIPKLKTNWRLGSAISFPNYNDKGEVDDYDNYRAQLKEFTIKKQGSNKEILATMVLDDDNFGASLNMYEYLDEFSTYQLHYRAIWEVDYEDDGTYKPLVYKGKEMVEDSTIIFKTGKFPDQIYLKMVESLTPGHKQRYWHKDYANPHLRFNKDDPKIAELFPQTVNINGLDYSYEYIARISSVNPNRQKQVFEIPITKYPGSVPFKRLTVVNKSYKGIFTIPTVTSKDVTTTEVNFPDLDGLHKSLTGGEVYKLELIRRPEKPEGYQTGSAPSVQGGTGVIDSEGGESEVTYKVKKKYLNNTLETAMAEYTKLLFEYHFAVSKYESLDEKLNASDVRYIKSIRQRNDLSHPLEVKQVYQFSRWDTESYQKFQTIDDYYAFTAREGFDKYDLERIEKNAFINESSLNFSWSEYLYADQYKWDRSFNKELKAYLTKAQVADRGGIGKSKKDYLEQVMKPVWEQYNDLGLRWNIDFHVPKNTKQLNKEEIKKGLCLDQKYMKDDRDNRTNAKVFSSEEKYGLLFQDLKSRVVINQLRLMYDIGSTEKTKHVEEEGGLGGFFKDVADKAVHGATFGQYDAHIGETVDYGAIRGGKAYGDYWEKVYNKLNSGLYQNINLPGIGDYSSYHLNTYNCDHDGLTLSFPVYREWKEMNDKVSSSRNISFSLKPQHRVSGNPSVLAGKETKGELPTLKDGDLQIIYKAKTGSSPTQVLIKNKRGGLLPIPDYIFVTNEVSSSRRIPGPDGQQVLPIQLTYYNNPGDVVYAERGSEKIVLGDKITKLDDGSIDISQLFDNIDARQIVQVGLNKVSVLVKYEKYGKFYVDLITRGKQGSFVIEKDILDGSYSPYEPRLSRSRKASGIFSQFYDKHLPYRGSIQQIPGTINLTHYDWGGPAISYGDSDPDNNIGAFRFEEGVDIGVQNGKSFVQFNEKRESLKYTIDVEEAGDYTLDIEYSSTFESKLEISIDGRMLTPYPFILPSTNGLNNIKTITVKVNVKLHQFGLKTMKLAHDDSDNSGKFNLYNVTFNSTQPVIFNRIDENLWHRLMAVDKGGKITPKQYVQIVDDGVSKIDKRYTFKLTSNLEDATQVRFVKSYENTYMIETEFGTKIASELSGTPGEIPLYEFGYVPISPYSGLSNVLFDVKYLNDSLFILGNGDMDLYITQKSDKTLTMGTWANPTLFELEEVSIRETKRYYNEQHLVDPDFDYFIYVEPLEGQRKAFLSSYRATGYLGSFTLHKRQDAEPRSFLWSIKDAGDGYYYLYSNGHPISYDGRHFLKKNNYWAEKNDDYKWSFKPQKDGSVIIQHKSGKYLNSGNLARELYRYHDVYPNSFFTSFGDKPGPVKFYMKKEGAHHGTY